MTTSLDILQGEQQCTLGYVLPTLTVLKKKLRQTTSRHVNDQNVLNNVRVRARQF